MPARPLHGAMSRSASVSVPRRELYVVPERRTSLELEDAPRLMHDQQREYDSWPCDSFFLLPDAVLTMDAGTFRADLMSLDPALSASLPDWDLPGLTGRSASPARESSHKPRSPHAHVASRADRRSLTLLDHHEGLTVHTAGQGTVLIGRSVWAGWAHLRDSFYCLPNCPIAYLFSKFKKFGD